MSLLPTHAAASIAGLPHAEGPRKADRAPRKEPARAARRPDEVVVDTAAPDAVRHLASNDQEQAREDHQSHPQPYRPAPPGDGALDLRG